MPEKDGDEGKSTKSVVNKKQKQMMGEEGYDIARDMGRVRPSKDKKDATTMPVSDEVRKTQKVNKGPSAFERVKAKYGKSVMNVGKKKANEELDLTKVAEALGGYIVESTKDEEQQNKADQTKREKIQKRFSDQKKADASRRRTQGAGGREDLGSGKGSERVTGGEDKLKGTEDQIKDIKTGTRPVEKDVIKKITKDVDDEQVLRGPKADRSEKSRKQYDRMMRDIRRSEAQEKRREKLQDPKFRASETLRKAKQTDIKGGPSVKRGDPVPQEVIPVKKKPVPEIGGFQPNTFKPKSEPEPQLEPESRPARKRKSTATEPPFATRIGASGKPLPVSMRNVRVPRGRSIVKAEPSEIEKLKPSQKGNIIVRTKTKTRTQDPGIDPEVTTDSPNQRRAGVGNRTLGGTPPKTGPGFGKRFGQFMNFTRNNPVASLIGYDVLRKAAGGVKNQLKPVGVRGGKAIRVSAGR